MGNRLSRTVSGGNLTAKVHGASNLSYGLNDWRNGDTYDARGNTLTGDWDGDGVNTQSQADEYDFENRLVRAVRGTKTISFTYDGDGNRVRKNVLDGSTTTVTRYLVDDRNPSGYAQVLEEWKSVDAGATFALDVSYVYGLGIVSQKRGAVTSYYGRDGHGSVRLLINGSTGNVTDTYHYDAFGILLSGTQPTSNNYRYTGEQWDEDLGMYYLRARYYKPETGRFWTMDTFEGQREDPLSLHKYLYCSGNPINGVDPSGHGEMVDVLISTFISTALSAAMAGGEAYAKGYSKEKCWEAAQQGAVVGLVTGPFFVFKTVRLLGIGFGAVMTGMAIGEGQPEIATVRAAATALGGLGEAVNYYYVSSRELAGSGPAPGLLEVSARVKSTKAVQNYRGKKPVDFVYDPDGGTFVMGEHPLGHPGIGNVAKIPQASRLGGQIKCSDGKLVTTEWSGHYGTRWTPQLRAKFVEFMKQHNITVEHEVW